MSQRDVRWALQHEHKRAEKRIRQTDRPDNLVCKTMTYEGMKKLDAWALTTACRSFVVAQNDWDQSSCQARLSANLDMSDLLEDDADAEENEAEPGDFDVPLVDEGGLGEDSVVRAPDMEPTDKEIIMHHAGRVALAEEGLQDVAENVASSAFTGIEEDFERGISDMMESLEADLAEHRFPRPAAVGRDEKALAEENLDAVLKAAPHYKVDVQKFMKLIKSTFVRLNNEAFNGDSFCNIVTPFLVQCRVHEKVIKPQSVHGLPAEKIMQRRMTEFNTARHDVALKMDAQENRHKSRGERLGMWFAQAKALLAKVSKDLKTKNYKECVFPATWFRGCGLHDVYVEEFGQQQEERGKYQLLLVQGENQIVIVAVAEVWANTRAKRAGATVHGARC